VDRPSEEDEMSHEQRSPRFRRAAGVLVLLAGALAALPTSSTAAVGATRYPTNAVRVEPTLARDFRPGTPLSAAESRQLLRELHRLEDVASAGVEVPPGSARVPGGEAAQPSTETAAARFHGVPSAMVTGRNVTDTLARCATTCSTLAEPAAANEGSRVLLAGNNRHIEFSTNGGTSFTASSFPAGPASAPTACCDNDVVYDPSRGVTFDSILYLTRNASGTPVNGIIRIFVRRSIDTAPACFYDLDYDGTANNVVPDFPHIALGNDFLYVSANRISGTSWIGSSIQRLNIDNLSDCVTAAGNTFIAPTAQGQRVLTPAEGATDVMYFAWAEDTTDLRIFAWPEASNSASSVLKSVSAMTFGDADCRGGTGNADWADSIEASGLGFASRTVVQEAKNLVSVFLATAADASHAQGHIHGFTFRVGGSPTALTLVSSPVVFTTSQCTGLPSVASNVRGDLGVMIAIGGRAGGGGTAGHAAFFMIDQFNPGPGGFSLTTAVNGTQNRSDSRYGDYFTVRRHSPDGLFFSATAYALNGGTALSNVDARYVEFGRGRDAQGYLAWRDAVPAT
jgi:hypothetical protein